MVYGFFRRLAEMQAFSISAKIKPFLQFPLYTRLTMPSDILLCQSRPFAELPAQPVVPAKFNRMP